MEDFTEMNEVQRLENEANAIKEELNHLIFLRSSGNRDFDDIDFLISEKRNEYFELKYKLELYNKMGDENNDRHKNNKRK